MNPLEIEVKRTDTGRGSIAALNRAGRSKSVYYSTALSSNPKFGPVLGPVDGAYNAMVEGIAEYHRNGHVGNALDVEINRRSALFQPIMLNGIQGIKNGARI